MRVFAIAASALVPFAAVAGPTAPSDFGLTFGTASTTTVSTLDNAANTTTYGGNIVSKHAASARARIDAMTYTVTSSDGFFFRQTVDVQGNGSASSTTTLDLAFTNTQATTQNIRFDSFVIPGHFGFRRVGGDTLHGAIDFKVSLAGSTLFSGEYTATEDPASATYNITNGVTGGATFNGASSYNTNVYYPDGPVYANARDWWTHQFYLDLGSFAPGEVKHVIYASTVSASVINTSGSCIDLADLTNPINYNSTCSGVSVDFGDPRRGTGIVGAVVTQQGAPGSPILGYQTNPYFTALRAYQTNRPEAPQENPPFTPNYGPNANGQGGGGGSPPPPPVNTPEPDAVALLSLGAIGIALVRRSYAPRCR